MAPYVVMHGQRFDKCGVHYHLHCVGQLNTPKYGSRVCHECLKAKLEGKELELDEDKDKDKEA